MTAGSPAPTSVRMNSRQRLHTEFLGGRRIRDNSQDNSDRAVIRKGREITRKNSDTPDYPYFDNLGNRPQQISAREALGIELGNKMATSLCILEQKTGSSQDGKRGKCRKRERTKGLFSGETLTNLRVGNQ